MMVTDSERRDTAIKIRDVAYRLGVNMDAQEFSTYIADILDPHECMCWCDMALKLADLIEPEQERNCQKRNHDTDDYGMMVCSCSECNAGWLEREYDKPFSYCPHCGAKIVKEVRFD